MAEGERVNTLKGRRRRGGGRHGKLWHASLKNKSALDFVTPQCGCHFAMGVSVKQLSVLCAAKNADDRFMLWQVRLII